MAAPAAAARTNSRRFSMVNAPPARILHLQPLSEPTDRYPAGVAAVLGSDRGLTPEWRLSERTRSLSGWIAAAGRRFDESAVTTARLAGNRSPQCAPVGIGPTTSADFRCG